MSINLKAIKTDKKSGSEPFKSHGQELPIQLLSFWQWSSSDLVGNALRGMLAEYIVSYALGDEREVRQEWDAYDIQTPDGIKVEVKSSAHLQSWPQCDFSNITFNIKKTKGWNAKTNEYSSKFMRQADVYVFCLLNHKDKATVEPLNLDQ